MVTSSGGFGTRYFFLPNAGADLKNSQILKGKGYATINIKGAHYRADGNLWQKIFGGTDQVSLSTQVDHVSGVNVVSSASIEEVRQIEVGHPYYFGSGRPVALKLPTDCDAIDMGVTISAIKNDNLSGALNILNSGELKGTLQMAPPAVSGALTIANIVKKLLTNTDPQNSLQGNYAGKLSLAGSDDPIRDYCLVQGTIILIYRESEDDTSLDDLDSTKFTTDGDGLKYGGALLQNTYVMFQISFDELRGEDPLAPWSSMFTDAEQSLNAVGGAANDTDKQKIWAAAYASYSQAVKLLDADPSYTNYEKTGLIASHYQSLKSTYANNGGHVTAAATEVLMLKPPKPSSNDVEELAKDYQTRLARANVALPGGRAHI